MVNIKGQRNNHKFISLFSPPWCLRPPSTKNSSSSSSSSPNNSNKIKNARFTNEPSSPRVGCMGQVKRRKPSSSDSTNSSSSSSSSTNSPSNVKNRFSLLMIKRIISSKILLVEMDPPRPVEKRKEAENNSASLWTRRRCNGGDGIKLQLQSNEQICV